MVAQAVVFREAAVMYESCLPYAAAGATLGVKSLKWTELLVQQVDNLPLPRDVCNWLQRDVKLFSRDHHFGTQATRASLLVHWFSLHPAT